MSTAITFALICRKNPNITDVDDIENILRIDLDHCNVEHIDNLDLFSHIHELNLSFNKIKSLSNLHFLRKLRFLDVSGNDISGRDLVNAVKILPRSLTTIVLSGNPCATDEDALGFLQDSFPELGIAIEELDDAEGKELVEGQTASDEEEEVEVDQDSSEENKRGLVDADDVLKYIVDRKCKLQSVQAFNLESIVKELNEEAEKVIEETKKRRDRMKEEHESSLNLSASSSSYQQRVEKLKRQNEKEKTAFEEVMGRLRSTTKEHFAALDRRKLDQQLQNLSITESDRK